MRVRFTRPAQIDLQRIYDDVSEDDPVKASRLIVQIVERAWGLAGTPYEGRKADEPNAYVLVIPRLHYFIFYTIAADEVHITHVRHTARRRPPGWQRRP